MAARGSGMTISVDPGAGSLGANRVLSDAALGRGEIAARGARGARGAMGAIEAGGAGMGAAKVRSGGS